jgi:hypothetical protein
MSQETEFPVTDDFENALTELSSTWAPSSQPPSQQPIEPPTPSIYSFSSTPSTPSIFEFRAKNRRSWVYQHGTIGRDPRGKEFWQCNYCPRAKRYADGSTKHQKDHLHIQHRIGEDGPLPDTTDILQRAFQNSAPRVSFNDHIFRDLLLRWIVICNVSFIQVEAMPFRLLLSYLCSVTSSHTAIPRTLPRSANTIRAWVMDSFQEQRNLLIQEFSTIPEYLHVHFSFDL